MRLRWNAAVLLSCAMSLQERCTVSYLQSIVPSEILILIVKFLQPLDKLRLRLTCQRLYEVVSNLTDWRVASFDHDHFTNCNVLGTILTLCGPGTKSLDINTRGMNLNVSWVTFLKRLTRMSSTLSHLSLVGVKISKKQLDMLLNACSNLTHLKIEYFFDRCHRLPPWESENTDLRLSQELCLASQLFPKPGDGQSVLQSFELHIDILWFFTQRDIDFLLKIWIRDHCYPKHLVISFGGRHMNRFYIPSDWDILNDVQVSSGVEGKFSVPDYFELVVKDCKVSLLATRCSAIWCNPIPLVQSQTRVCTGVYKYLCHYDSPDIYFEVPFSDVGHTITHFFITGPANSLEGIAYNCPNLKYLSCPRASNCLSELDNISKKCVKLEALDLCPWLGRWFRGTCNVSLDILFQIRNLSFLSITLEDIPLDCDLQQKKLERLRHLKLRVGGYATSEHLIVLRQLITTHLKKLWIYCNLDSSIDSGLRNFLLSLPDLQSLSLSKFGSIDIPCDSLCYQKIEKLQLKVLKLSIGKALIDSLVEGGHLSHCYITARHISIDALDQLIHSPHLVVCHLCLESFHEFSDIITASDKKMFKNIFYSATNIKQFSLTGFYAEDFYDEVYVNVHPDLPDLRDLSLC